MANPLKDWTVEDDPENTVLVMQRPCPGEKSDRLIVQAAAADPERRRLLAEREAMTEEIRVAPSDDVAAHWTTLRDAKHTELRGLTARQAASAAQEN